MNDAVCEFWWAFIAYRSGRGSPLIKLFERCATLRTGQPHTRALVEPVLELIARGALEQSLIRDDVVDWEDAPDAFRRGRGKVVCTRTQ